MRLYIILFLLPLMIVNNSDLELIQTKIPITKKQTLQNLLTANNLTIADLSQAQQDTLTAMELTLAQNQPNTLLEDDDDIGKSKFFTDFKKHIGDYMRNVSTYKKNFTPIVGKNFTSFLKDQMSSEVYGINKTLYNQVVKGIPEGSTNKNDVAEITLVNLNFYLQSDGVEIKNLTKRLRKKYPDLNIKKSLNGVLPSPDNFILAFSSDAAEDKMDLNHEEMKLYVGKLSVWANKLNNTWNTYSNQGDYRYNYILTKKLAKELKEHFTEDPYFEAMALQYEIALSSLDASTRCENVCSLLAKTTKEYATTDNMRPYYDAVKYKDTLNLDFTITLETIHGILNDALDKQVENEPDYASFQKDLKQAIDLFIKDFQLSDANLSEALIDMPSFQKHILTVSNGLVAPLVTKKLLTLKTDQSLPQTGAIVEAIKKQANALRQENALYEAWKENKLNFPIAAQYIDAVQKSVVQVDKGTFADAFQQWKNKVEGIKFAKNWTLDKSKLDKELQRVFTAAHGSFDAGGFLYNQALTPLLKGLKGQTLKINSNDNTTDNDQTFSTIWKTMFEKCDSTLLENAYEAYKTKTSSAKELENYVSVLDSVFPDTKTIEIALSCSRHFTYVPKTGASLTSNVTLLSTTDSANTDTIKLDFTLPIVYRAFEINKQSLFFPIVDKSKVTVVQNTTGRYSDLSIESIDVGNLAPSEDHLLMGHSVVVKLTVKDDTSISYSTDTSYNNTTITIGGSAGLDKFGADVSVTPGSYSGGDSTGESRGAGGTYTLFITLRINVDKSTKPGMVNLRVRDYSFGDMTGSNNQNIGLEVQGDLTKRITVPYEEVSK